MADRNTKPVNRTGGASALSDASKTLYESADWQATLAWLARLQAAMMPGAPPLDVESQRPKERVPSNGAGWTDSIMVNLMGQGAGGQTARICADILRGQLAPTLRAMVVQKQISRLYTAGRSERERAAFLRKMARDGDLAMRRKRRENERAWMATLRDWTQRLRAQHSDRSAKVRDQVSKVRHAPVVAAAARDAAAAIAAGIAPRRRDIAAVQATATAARSEVAGLLAAARTAATDRIAGATARRDEAAGALTSTTAVRTAVEKHAAGIAAEAGIGQRPAEAVTAPKPATAPSPDRERRRAAERRAIACAFRYLLRERGLRDEAKVPAGPDEAATKLLIGAKNRAESELNAAKGNRTKLANGERRIDPEAPRPCRAWCAPEHHAEDKRDAIHDAHLAAGTAVMPAGWKDVRDAKRADAEVLNGKLVARCMVDVRHAIGRKKKGKHAGEAAVQQRGKFADQVVNIEAGHKAWMIYASKGLPVDGGTDAVFEAFATNLPVPKVNDKYLLDPISGNSTRFAHVVNSWSPKVPDEELTVERMAGQTLAKLTLMGIQPEHHRIVLVVHKDKKHTHVHAWIDRVRDDGKVWAMKGVPRTVAASMVNNVSNAAFLFATGNPNPEQPVSNAPVYGGKHYALAQGYLNAAADGDLRCNLLWQEPYVDENGVASYDTSPQRSPWHGGPKDREADSRRALFGRKLINDAMAAAGLDSLQIPGGFLKFDDLGRGSLEEETADEWTHQNATIGSDPEHTRSWLYAPAEEPRKTSIKEHLKRKQAAKAA